MKLNPLKKLVKKIKDKSFEIFHPEEFKFKKEYQENNPETVIQSVHFNKKPIEIKGQLSIEKLKNN